MNRDTPASRACLATRIVPSTLTSWVIRGVEVARRVVGDAGEVHDSVDALEGLGADVADVVADDLEARAALEVGERLATEEQPVERTDLVAGVEQQFAQHGADVAACAGDEHRGHAFLLVQ